MRVDGPTVDSPSIRSSTPVTVARLLALMALAIGVAVVLAELYSGLKRFTDMTGWLAAASVHTLLAICWLIHRWRLPREYRQPTTLRTKLFFFAPAVVILGGAALLVAVSRQFGVPDTRWENAMSWPQFLWLVWIPPIEEAVFRGGIGGTFRRLLPGLWGSWLAAVTFALVHANPTVANLVTGHLGLPLGPFLLALCCEALVVQSGRLGPAIAFHVACNATVAVFTAGDARWLEWLGMLYL